VINRTILIACVSVCVIMLKIDTFRVVKKIQIVIGIFSISEVTHLYTVVCWLTRRVTSFQTINKMFVQLGYI